MWVVVVVVAIFLIVFPDCELRVEEGMFEGLAC